MMPSSSRKSTPGNLLIESPSDDSDVPDLELIAPVKARRKKLFSKKFSPRLNIKGGDDQTQVPCSSSCALGCLLFSLVLGLVVLSCFTLSLSNELSSLKESVAGRCNSSESVQKAVDELRDELKRCCASSGSSSKIADDNKNDQTKHDAPSTAQGSTDHISNTEQDTNSSNILTLTNDVAQLTNTVFLFMSNTNGHITNITQQLNSLEVKCSSAVCPPASSSTASVNLADSANVQNGSGPPGTVENKDSPALLPKASIRRRSDFGADEGSFQFVRKP